MIVPTAPQPPWRPNERGQAGVYQAGVVRQGGARPGVGGRQGTTEGIIFTNVLTTAAVYDEEPVSPLMEQGACATENCNALRVFVQVELNS